MITPEDNQQPMFLSQACRAHRVRNCYTVGFSHTFQCRVSNRTHLALSRNPRIRQPNLAQPQSPFRPLSDREQVARPRTYSTPSAIAGVAITDSPSSFSFSN